MLTARLSEHQLWIQLGWIPEGSDACSSLALSPRKALLWLGPLPSGGGDLHMELDWASRWPQGQQQPLAKDPLEYSSPHRPRSPPTSSTLSSLRISKSLSPLEHPSPNVKGSGLTNCPHFLQLGTSGWRGTLLCFSLVQFGLQCWGWGPGP